MMTDQVPVHSEPRVERLAIVEADALEDRIPLLVSSNQQLFAQGAGESTEEFSLRFVKRVTSLPSARMGLLLLGDDDNFEARWSILLALASRLQAAQKPELIISVRSGSASELVAWYLVERASHFSFFRGIHLRIQFVPSRDTEAEAEAEAAPAPPSSGVRLARPTPVEPSRPLLSRPRVSRMRPSRVRPNLMTA